MICDTKYEYLMDVFTQMKDEQVRAVTLLALERMWLPYKVMIYGRHAEAAQ